MRNGRRPRGSIKYSTSGNAPSRRFSSLPPSLSTLMHPAREQEASFKWSPDGRAVLCLTSTDVDATGKVRLFLRSTVVVFLVLFVAQQCGCDATVYLPPKLAQPRKMSRRCAGNM